MVTATIVGSGPNGLSAAIVLASAGIETDETRRECASLKKVLCHTASRDISAGSNAVFVKTGFVN